MAYLPVPPLEQTLQRYLSTVKPLLDVAGYASASEAVTAFADGEGKRCQEELLRFADHENAAGRSWLSEAWYDAYLTVRTPPPLTTSIGFQIAVTSERDPLDRAADLVHRLGAVHLAHLRGEIPPLVNGRGQPLCMQQWSYLAGGIRSPRPGRDEMVPGPGHAEGREIVVLHRGRAYAVRIGDGAGQVISRRVLKEALASVLDDPTEAATPFSAWSYFGSDTARAYQEEALADEVNARTHRRLVEALFVVNLVDEATTADAHLARTAFGHGAAWPLKPVSYQVGLADGWQGEHVEHTLADGLTLQAVVDAAQRVEPVDLPGTAPIPEPLTWSLSDDFRSRLQADVEAYRLEASAYRVRTVSVPSMPHGGPIRLSHDGIQQFILLYAQLRTYGRLRSTYEPCDMREYQAGRTETVRPNTTEAVALARALIAGRARIEDFVAASDAHRRTIKVCKSGQGIDRHLLGLRLMADRLSLRPRLYDDPAYLRLTTDFLSTSSVGDADRLVQFAFGPTALGGIGVKYGQRDDRYDYVLTWDERRCERLDAFAVAVQEGAAALRTLIATVP